MLPPSQRLQPRPDCPRRLLRHRRQRRPAGYGPGADPRVLIVREAWEQAAQLDGGRQFAALLEGGTDRGGISFGNHEHRRIIGRWRLVGNAKNGRAGTPNRTDLG
jgi:hypothetical protein